MGKLARLLIVLWLSCVMIALRVGGSSDNTPEQNDNPIKEEERRQQQIRSQNEFWNQVRSRTELNSDQEEVRLAEEAKRLELLHQFQQLAEQESEKQKTQSSSDTSNEAQKQPTGTETSPPAAQVDQASEDKKSGSSDSADSAADKQWTMYGQDPTQAYEYQSNQQDEQSKLLGTKVELWARRLDAETASLQTHPIQKHHWSSTETEQLPRYPDIITDQPHPSKEEMLNIRISKSDLDHFVVLLLFVSVFIRFVICRNPVGNYQRVPADPHTQLQVV